MSEANEAQTNTAQPDETPPLATPAEATPGALPADAELIGPLVFVPNPEYPYPFKVATPPRFWMEETTGALNEAVDTYMNGEKLSTEQINLIRLYLRQYIERALLSGEANKKLLLSKIDKLKTTTDIERYADELSEYGAEVF
jgi:hypothetical protein